MRKFSIKRVLSEQQRQAAVGGLDLLREYETASMRELVQEVHRAGYRGSGWPVVSSLPMRWNGKHMVVSRENPEQWVIQVWVEAMPEASRG